MPSGYLIVKTFDRVWAEFASPTTDQAIYGIPRKGILAAVARKRYRGIDRDAICDHYRSLPNRERDVRLEAEAQALLAKMGAEEASEWGDAKVSEGLILRWDDVLLLLSKIRDRIGYEVIWVRDYLYDIEDVDSVIPDSSALLGYEPSNGREHFSAIADCLFFPRWHGTDMEGVLFASWYESLNENGLFNSATEALNFLDFYRSREWTETGLWEITEAWLPPQP